MSANTNARRHVLLANRAACYMRMTPRDVASATRDLQECVVLAPEYITGWERLVRLLSEEEMEEKMMRVATEGLQHHPESVEMLRALARRREEEEEVVVVDENSVPRTDTKSNAEALAASAGSAPVEVVQMGKGKGAKAVGNEETPEEKVEALRRMMGL